MTTENGVCYYALHIGCPNVADPNCKRCAQGLTNAVNQMLRPIEQENRFVLLDELQAR
jgi:hypothetical protein